MTPRLLKPPEGGYKGKSIAPYIESMVKEYYQAMCWEMGKPLRSELEQLDLSDIAKDLYS